MTDFNASHRRSLGSTLDRGNSLFVDSTGYSVLPERGRSERRRRWSAIPIVVGLLVAFGGVIAAARYLMP